jgi:hypothetical protein
MDENMIDYSAWRFSLRRNTQAAGHYLSSPYNRRRLRRSNLLAS